MRKPSLILSIWIALIASLGIGLESPAFSHGFVNNPESRSYFCNQGGNANCGSIQFEPQSVEGADGFPETGAPDGTIAAAGKNEWAPLNEQSATRWKKRVIAAGRQSFSWHFTAPHVTRSFQYYITKANWNANEKLSRASFDLNPFCRIDGGMQKPPVDVTHDCVVPERQGYHIILALWDVGDTAATFYQVIDVQFGGTAPAPEPSKPSAPTPSPGTGSPGTPAPDCNTGKPSVPMPGAKLCKAKAGTAASDLWCNTNCNHNPAFCPTDLCSCGADQAGYAQGSSNSGQDLKSCKALPRTGADDSWCQINCNHNPSFCPETLCQCS